MLVKAIMKRDIASCHIDTNLEAVALLMWNHDCGAIPVVDSANKPIGIVTDRDIVMACALNNRAPWDLQADEVIDGRPLISCTENDDIVAALSLMGDYRVRRLPVIDTSEALEGMLSMSDIIQAAQNDPSPEQVSFDDLVEPLKAISRANANANANRAPTG